MKELDNKSLIEKYITSAIVQGEATNEGDYKKGNKEVKKLQKIYKFMEKNKNLRNELLSILLYDSNVNVRIWSSAHALVLNVKKEVAEKNLKEISEMTGIGILRSTAEITLEQWKKGELEF